MKTIIKTTIIILALAIGIDIMCSAIPVSNYNKVNNTNITTNITLKKTLNLTDEQNSDLMFFYNMLNSNIDSAMCERDSVTRSKMLANAVEMNTMNVKMILTHEQYHKYLRILNLTLNNKNIKISKN
jgi:hypothetical protein